MKKNKKGFTIIEVVLVLAIGGLIFLMVFIALPAMQRSQRNTQRKRIADEVFAAVQEYRSNNNTLPFSYDGRKLDTKFVERYIDSSCTYTGITDVSEWGDTTFSYGFDDCEGNFTDPDGETYSIRLVNGNTNSFTYSDDIKHYIILSAGCKCGTTEGQKIATNKRNDFVVYMKLEGGGMYCLDNS